MVLPVVLDRSAMCTTAVRSAPKKTSPMRSYCIQLISLGGWIWLPTEGFLRKLLPSLSSKVVLPPPMPSFDAGNRSCHALFSPFRRLSTYWYILESHTSLLFQVNPRPNTLLCLREQQSPKVGRCITPYGTSETRVCQTPTAIQEVRRRQWRWDFSSRIAQNEAELE